MSGAGTWFLGACSFEREKEQEVQTSTEKWLDAKVSAYELPEMIPVTSNKIKLEIRNRVMKNNFCIVSIEFKFFNLAKADILFL